MSAVVASPAVAGVPADPVRALQHALYRAAKAWPRLIPGDGSIEVYSEGWVAE